MEFLSLIELKNLESVGVVFQNIYNTFIDKKAVIYSGCEIGNNVNIIGDSIINHNAKIHSNTTILNSVVGEGTVVKTSYITDSEIGINCEIGPFAHIKQNSKLGNDLRIGNYVEIKNSIIGDGTKCAHLTYVGDAEIGKRVNLGCGVVFANYDGKQKHKTIVGDDVFVGCNCNLIAPLQIENNCYICAGTTVTKNLSTNSFCIGRVRDESRPRKN